MNSVVAVIRWYLIVQLVGTLAWPVASRFFDRLPDRGYAFSKILGILLTGVLLWLGTCYGVVWNTPAGAWLAVVAMGVVSVRLGGVGVLPPDRGKWRAWLGECRAQWGTILATELVFLIGFAGWAVYRCHDPAIDATEQPMDVMFMNGIRGSLTFPPRDPWLSGYAIGYYYMGYWLLVTLANLSGLPTELAYNVGQSCWYGLLMMGCFAVGANLVRLDRGRSRRRGWGATAVLGGVLAALAVGAVANVRGSVDAARAEGGFDWWPASRVIKDRDLGTAPEPLPAYSYTDAALRGRPTLVIDEFPAFSYFVGDNHPHLLAMPVLVLVVGMGMTLLVGGSDPPESRPDKRSTPGKRPAVLDYARPGPGPAWVGPWLGMWRNVGTAVPMGPAGVLLLIVVCGAMLCLNTWDFPACWLLIVVSVFGSLRRSGARGEGWAASALVAVLVPLGSVLVYFPYFLTAQSQFAGFVPNFLNPTHLGHFALVWGLFAPGVVLVLVLAILRVWPRLRRLGVAAGVVVGLPLACLLLGGKIVSSSPSLVAWLRPGGKAGDWASVALGRWCERPWTFLVIGMALTVAVTWLWEVWGRPGGAKGEGAKGEAAKPVRMAPSPGAVFAVVLVGLALVLVMVPEVLFVRDTFDNRMNTVFKFYYQAWLLLGLAAAYGTVAGFRNRWTIAPSIVSVVALLAGLTYVSTVVWTKTSNFKGTRTLDGLAFMRTSHPQEVAAINWIRDNTAPDAVIAERAGNSYKSRFNRVSAFTGRATLLGWQGHERQWRGSKYGEMAAGRTEALNAIYKAGSVAGVKKMLAKWGIDYVYVRPAEGGKESWIGPEVEKVLGQAMDEVFRTGAVLIYRRRGEEIR